MVRPLVSLALVPLLVTSTLTSWQDTNAQTPEATPTPTPVSFAPGPAVAPPDAVSICASAQYHGGEIVIVDNIQITFPNGDFAAGGGIADPGGQFVRVCYLQGNSAIFFNLRGVETSRVVNMASANAVLDQVAASVRVVGQQAPTPVPTVVVAFPGDPIVTATPETRGVRPPDTGDGGMIAGK